MKVLLDTQALILAGQNRLPPPAAKTYLISNNEIYFSVASLWEVGIKASLKKLKFDMKVTDYQRLLLRAGLFELPIEASHIEQSVALPFHHRDPFDRLIAGQALVESMTVISGDQTFGLYGCQRIWD